MFKFLIGFFTLFFCFTACKNNPGKKHTESSSVKNTAGNSEKNRASEFAFTVVPGERLGNMVIGANATAVMDSLGTPDTGDAAMGKAENTWKIDVNGKESVLTLFTSRKMGEEDFSRIQLVRTTLEKYRLKNGLHVGSTQQALKKQFSLKKLGDFSKNDTTYQLYDTSQGIAFEIGPDQKCHGMLIHDPQKSALQFYLGVYQNFQKKNN